MSDDQTTRFALPLIFAGQAQKEMTHNEALTAIDALLHPAVQGVAAAPPAEPALGDSWIVGAPASGVWLDREDCIATWTAGGWRFHVPRPGMTAMAISDGVALAWRSTGWSQGEVRATSYIIGSHQVVGPQRPAIDDPLGGAVVDEEARMVIGELLTALRTHGLISAA